MMLFKLSLSNLRKSIQDYAVYFFTLVIGVAVFYVFNSIETQTAFLEISTITKEIITLLLSMLSGVSVFVSVVLGLLIVYASRFMMKRRNREFALYLMLGMGKGKISAIIFIETFIIGLISLAAGLVVGIIASQFMSTFAANLFEANMSQYHFAVSGKAILKTIAYFGIMYIAEMLFNGIIVSKCRLIDLMQSGKKSEKLKLKNPVLCVLIFLVSSLALAYAYYRVCFNTAQLYEKDMIIMICIGSVSTFFIFWSVSGMLLRIIMSVKKVYYRGLNSFTFRQLSSKVNTMVMSMTIICLMLFVTICTLSSAFSMRNSLNRNINEYCPADFQMKYSSQSEDYINRLNNENQFESYFSDYVTFSQYEDKNATIGAFLGDTLDDVLKEYPSLAVDSVFPVYRISDYNTLMKLYGYNTISLSENKYVMVSNFSGSSAFYNNILKENIPLNINGHKLEPMYQKCQNGFVDISVQPMNDGIIIVPDDAVIGAAESSEYFTGNYDAKTKTEKVKIEQKLISNIKNVTDNIENESEFSYKTKLERAESATGLGGVVIFLGLYIGLIFLISSGVILALRSLSDAVDSTSRYTTLRKIGAPEKDISKSLFRQTALFFAIPLILAYIHSIFGIKFAMNYVLQIFGTDTDGMAKSIAGSGIIILLIYGGYFLITYLCSKSIVKNKL